MSLPGQTPPRPAPTKYATPLGTRWDKEIAAAGGVSAFDLPSDPKNIGPWIMGECIGKGASGRVKLARHKDTEQLAAVKILPLDPVFNSRASLATQKAKSEKQRLGIDREITMMKLMNHPNIMRIYDVFEGTKELFLVLEYVEGGELFDYLVNRGRLSSMEAFVYFRQIIHGLNYAHTFSIIHRDLKPENILISSLSPTVIKIADWGMAAFAPPTLHLETSCGSPHYASPEIVNGEKYQGTATDIWSCGVILFALLTGRLPFDDKNVRHLLGKVKAGKYDMPTWIDPQAQDLLRRMIVVDVKKRITVRNLLCILSNFADFVPQIPEILAHPWLTASRSQAMPKQLGYRPVKLDSPPLPPSPSDLAKPIDDPAEIDDELLASLQIIWGRHAEPSGANIRRDLCSPAGEGVHAKAFYFLLGRYREETTAARKGDVGEDDSRLKYRSMGSFNLGWELDAKLLGASLVLDAENQILGHRQSRRLSAVPRQLSLVREFSATTQPRAHSPAGPRSQTPDPTIRKKHLSDEHDNHSRGSVFLDPESDIFVPSFNATRGRPAHHREQTNTTRPRAATSTSSNAPDVQLTRPSHPARRTASHRASRRPAPLEVHSDFGIPQKQQARVLQRTSTRASEVPELDPDPLFDMDMGHVPASPVPTRLTIAAQSEMLRKARQDDITKATKRMTLAKHPNSSISPAPHRAIAQVLKSNHEGKENRSLDEDWSYISGSGDSPGVKSKETNAPPSRKSLFFDVRKEKAKSRRMLTFLFLSVKSTNFILSSSTGLLANFESPAICLVHRSISNSISVSDYQS